MSTPWKLFFSSNLNAETDSENEFMKTSFNLKNPDKPIQTDYFILTKVFMWVRHCIHFDWVIITIVRQPPLSKDAVQNMWLPFYLMNLSCRHPSRPLPRGDAAVEWACITTPVLQPLTLTAPSLKQPWVLTVTCVIFLVYLISLHHCANWTTLTVSCPNHPMKKFTF